MFARHISQRLVFQIVDRSEEIGACLLALFNRTWQTLSVGSPQRSPAVVSCPRPKTFSAARYRILTVSCFCSLLKLYKIFTSTQFLLFILNWPHVNRLAAFQIDRPISPAKFCTKCDANSHWSSGTLSSKQQSSNEITKWFYYLNEKGSSLVHKTHLRL